MPHRDAPADLRPQVFYLIRAFDVELAEDFVRRCPEVHDLTSLNAFFHRILTQYQDNTANMRALLADDVDLNTWLRMFKENVLPYLRNHRFPPCTDRTASPFYQLLDGCSSGLSSEPAFA
jgi:hypothetical protein